MHYIDDNLVEGESVIFQTTLHWITACLPLIGSLFFWLCAWLEIGLNEGYPALGYFLMGGLIASAPFIAISTSEFGIATQRVMIKVGLLQTHTLEIFLSKVESISVDQTIVG